MTKETENHLDTIMDIKSLMEKSTSFFSISGLSGIYIGIVALLGLGSLFYLPLSLPVEDYFDIHTVNVTLPFSDIVYLAGAALSVLIISLGIGFYFSKKKSEKSGRELLNKSSIRVLVQTTGPLVYGGLFCFALAFNNMFGFIAVLTLLFYGFTLLNISKHSLIEIKFLGLSQITLAFVAVIFGYELVCWGIGFGVLHVIYGILMYRKYDR